MGLPCPLSGEPMLFFLSLVGEGGAGFPICRQKAQPTSICNRDRREVMSLRWVLAVKRSGGWWIEKLCKKAFQAGRLIRHITCRAQQQGCHHLFIMWLAAGGVEVGYCIVGEELQVNSSFMIRLRGCNMECCRNTMDHLHIKKNLCVCVFKYFFTFCFHFWGANLFFMENAYWQYLPQIEFAEYFFSTAIIIICRFSVFVEQPSSKNGVGPLYSRRMKSLLMEEL